MSSIASIPNLPENAPNQDVALIMLKKSQDSAKDTGNALIAALPKPPSPRGMGQNLDLSA